MIIFDKKVNGRIWTKKNSSLDKDKLMQTNKEIFNQYNETD